MHKKLVESYPYKKQRGKWKDVDNDERNRRQQQTLQDNKRRTNAIIVIISVIYLFSSMKIV